MTTAWQKAMRGKPRKIMWKVLGVVELRPNTYEAEVDTGSDGIFTARMYPGGQIDSSRRLTDKEVDKLESVFLKFAKL